ncbi:MULTISPECIES: MFS transporter [unclassified Desulfovibrio]|uniref:MFS transporter n=1 Tax=unclassified Desulfovibrio TaxID=2593640 RepID=UPI00163AAD4D|nr:MULTISPECIES: MFS transporter [unclassified Desulfovibrio]
MQKVTVDSIIEKIQLNKVHYYIVVTAALGFMFDSFDTYIVAYAMPSIIKEWAITPVQNGMLTSAGFWGMFLGSMILGPVADRFGRKLGFILTIMGFSVLTGLTALSGDVYQFGIIRFLTGMFLGGMIPINTAMVSEYVSAKHRGRFAAVLTILWPFGLLAASLASLTLVTTHGWRVLFYIGALPAMLAIVVVWKVPESPRWLSIRGRTRDVGKVLKKLGARDEDLVGLESEKLAEKVPVTVLLHKQYIRRFILTGGYYFFSYFGYYGFVLWLPTILATVYNLDLARTFTYTLYVAIAAILGRLTAFYTIEKFGRKQLFYVGFGIGGVAALVFGQLQDPSMLVIGACVLSWLYEQGVAGTVVWTAELYPSQVRATATCWSTGLGRVSSAVAPVVFGYFMANGMYYAIFVTMAISFWIAVALVFFLGIETKGKTLQEVGAA